MMNRKFVTKMKVVISLKGKNIAYDNEFLGSLSDEGRCEL